MQRDREKWDEKHGAAKGAGKPIQLVRDYHRHAPPGRALDLACGTGRHALFLADKGFAVDAVDISAVALDRFQHARITKVRSDLDDWRPAPRTYALIVCTYFLDRALLASIRAALQPGGLLLFETFLASSDHIREPRFKLAPNELLHRFARMRVRYYREKADVASLAAVAEPVAASEPVG